MKLSVSSHAVPRAGQTPQPIITGIERKEEEEGDEIILQSTAEKELNISNCSIYPVSAEPASILQANKINIFCNMGI